MNHHLQHTAPHGTVEKKIRQIVKSMDADVAYMFMNWAQSNVEIDEVSKPTIIYVLPPSGTLDIGWAQVKDSPLSQIAFVAPTEFDFDGVENDDIIEQMKRLCIKFVKAFNESGMFRQIEGGLTYRVLYDHFDRNVTGIVITPQLEEEEGVFICGDDEVRAEDE